MQKILLIEDDEIMIRMCRRVFKYEGYDVEVATDGEQGFSKATSFKPDMILLDIMMPHLNGLQTLDKLKGDLETKDIPVIMLTNLANKSDAEVALQKGAVKYLVKSDYDPQEVLWSVKEFFSKGN